MDKQVEGACVDMVDDQVMGSTQWDCLVEVVQ